MIKDLIEICDLTRGRFTMKKVKSRHVDDNVEDLMLTGILVAVGVIGVIAGTALLILFGV